MRFKRVPGRRHEETPVRIPPQVDHVVIALQIRPDVSAADVVDQVAHAITGPVEVWYETEGRELLLSAPDIA